MNAYTNPKTQSRIQQTVRQTKQNQNQTLNSALRLKSDRHEIDMIVSKSQKRKAHKTIKFSGVKTEWSDNKNQRRISHSELQAYEKSELKVPTRSNCSVSVLS